MTMTDIAKHLLVRFLGKNMRDIRVDPALSIVEGISSFDIHVESLYCEFKDLFTGMEHLYSIAESRVLPHDDENNYNESHVIHITHFPRRNDYTKAQCPYRHDPKKYQMDAEQENNASLYAAIMDIIFVLPPGDIDAFDGQIYGTLHIGLPDAIDAYIGDVLKKRRTHNFRAWQADTMTGVHHMIHLLAQCPEIQHMPMSDLEAEIAQKFTLDLMLLSTKTSRWMGETT